MPLAALAVLRQQLWSVQERCREQALSTRAAHVSAKESPGRCEICNGPMVLQKTVRRHGTTLEHGSFNATDAVWACKAGCRHPSGMVATRRSQALAQCLPPRKVVGYDVMVYVGRRRFLEHRQREEIRMALKNEHGIALSTGEISILAHRFLDYLQALHEDRSEAIQEALKTDGGWPLHIDATGEDGRGTLLVAFAGWRQWALGAWKIPTERADAILPHLLSVVRQFGAPCAVMRDLGRAMIPAVNSLVAELELEIPVLACHQHFLADVGKDLLKAFHKELLNLFRKFKIRPGLRALARDLGRKFAGDIGQAREAVLAWLEQDKGRHVLPDGRDGLAVIRALVQWVLDYPADSTYRTFPFDRPYLDLYDRCVRARRAVDAFRRRLPDDRPLRRNIDRLCRLLDRILSDEHGTKVVAGLRARAKLFDELRDTLRLQPTPRHQVALSHERAPEEALSELRDIRSDLDRWVEALRKHRPERGPAKDTRVAIDLILDHIERHGHSLWGHAISLHPEAGGGVRLVDRTNNAQENFFKNIKHGERRRSGRKILTQDFESLPPAAALTRNLNCPDYVTILCGTLDELPAAFAKLDAECQQAKRAGVAMPHFGEEITSSVPVSASLPTADRRIVRSDAMGLRVDQAARSRAPRISKKAG